MTEIEVKILEINREDVERKLVALGAQKIREDVMEAVICFPEGPGWIKGDGIRIRKEKGKVILTVKKETEENPDLMNETEVEVGDFGKAREVINQLGFAESFSYKKRRITYELDDAEIVIDKYRDELAHIPEFMEIEAKSVEKVYEIVGKLGFQKEDCHFMGISKLIDYYSNKETPNFLKS